MFNGKTPESEFHLHNSYAFWVSRLASVMQEKFNQSVSEFDVTWPQWMVLNLLFNGSARTPAEIASALGVDRSAITRLVDRLEKKQLVQRHHDGLDRRTIQLLITAEGKRLIPKLNTIAKTHQDEFLSTLHSTEFRGLKGNLQKMLKAGGIDSSAEWKHF